MAARPGRGGPHGLAALTGTSSDAGVVGYTLGGGLPVLGRAYGYAADLVRSFQVVTPNGTLREADHTTEPELFWALRGGKGNVGVVTRLTFDLLPLPRILGGGIYCRGEHAEPLLRAWADWTRTVPPEMCSASPSCASPDPQIPEPLRGGFWARVAIAWTGDTAEGEHLIAPIREAAPVTVDTVEEMDYAAVDRIYMEPRDPLPARESCTLLRDLTPDAIRTFLDEAGPTAQDYPILLTEIRHMGGALSRPAAVEDAICARDAAYFLETVAIVASTPAAEAIERATTSPQHRDGPVRHGPHDGQHPWRPGRRTGPRPSIDPGGLRPPPTGQAHVDPANLLRYGHTVTPA
ncbi:hypothetical protein SALBM311S_11743 [Streptomyces alboniger]